MRTRRLADLQKAVSSAEKAGLEKRLGVQLAMARRILEQLIRIEKLRHAILNLDQKTIAELRSYSCPPPVVHRVMEATYLLLGEPDKHLKVTPLMPTQQTMCGFSTLCLNDKGHNNV